MFRCRKQTRNVFGASVGTILESYDFFAWFLLANEIAKAAWEDATPNMREILVIATFAGTFLIRPFGAAFYGYIGDRHGRVTALRLSTTMIGAGGIVFGCLPFGSDVYLRNIVLASLLRAFQAFNYGTQVAGASTFLTEHSREESENKTASMSLVGSGIGMMLAVGVVGLLKMQFTNDEMISWGWRIPFISELLLLLVGRILQVKMIETKHFQLVVFSSEISRNPIEDVFAEEMYSVVIIVLALSPWFSIYAIIIYFLPWYAITTLNQSSDIVFYCIVIALSTQIIFVYLGAIMADRFGHSEITYWSSLVCFVLTLPIFQMLLTYPDDSTMYTVCVSMLSMINGFGAGGIQVLSFTVFSKKSRRYSSMTISWNISMCIFSGGSVFLNSYGVQYTELFPAYFITFLSFVCILVCHCHFQKISSNVQHVKTEEQETTEETSDMLPVNIFARRYADTLSHEERSSKPCKARLQNMKNVLDRPKIFSNPDYDPLKNLLNPNLAHPELLNGFEVHRTLEDVKNEKLKTRILSQRRNKRIAQITCESSSDEEQESGVWL